MYGSCTVHVQFIYSDWYSSIRLQCGTNLSILLFPAGGTNTSSDHCYVINKQKYLDDFSSSFQQIEALSLLKKYQDICTGTKSNKRHVAAPADFDMCSK